MLVKIIGCHGGVAPGFKNTSFLIDGKLLIDAGAVASGLVIDEQVRIDNILISHPHLDHISDLAFLADNCFGLKNKPFEVFCNDPVIAAIKAHLMNGIIWPDFSVIPSVENPTIRFNSVTPEKEFQLGKYKITPVPVNHPNDALGFIVEREDVAILFTQDTGPTDRIWEIGKLNPKLRAIFTEVSFPNKMQNVANASFHHTPYTLKQELAKMPPKIPIFIGHLKPNFQSVLYQEIDALCEERLNIIGADDTTYLF